MASHNTGKIKEIEMILKNLDIEILGLSDIISIDDIEENADSLEGNAYIKADFAHNILGGLILADDTGLFVNALNGKPGVHTARYAGENSTEADNRNKLLKELENVSNREAYFETVIVLIDEYGKKYSVNGICEGKISTVEKGQEGFGYDKVFIPEGYDKTFAELTTVVKNSISHRAKALDKLKKLLVDVLDESSNN